MSTPFTNTLDQAGYFKSLSPEKAKLQKDYLDQHGWDGIFGESHRCFFADAENLAEGGLGKFFEEIEPFLAAQGVSLPEIVDEPTADGYIVRVGGKPHQIYDAPELKQDCNREKPGHIWGLAMARGFGIVNDLLMQAGSTERLYAVNGGNDLMALFLTSEQFRIIMMHPDAVPNMGRIYRPRIILGMVHRMTSLSRHRAQLKI